MGALLSIVNLGLRKIGRQSAESNNKDVGEELLPKGQIIQDSGHPRQKYVQKT